MASLIGHSTAGNNNKKIDTNRKIPSKKYFKPVEQWIKQSRIGMREREQRMEKRKKFTKKLNAKW